ncbi:MFS-type transporter SLC18B1-like [Coccinella septempunctata]|uniref:MFS-type transporter SLC18B1-like n=1 Tax=Coccinella septempunctata TaxID=41139 RepID=UPI001D09285E|nr:MFS-type transporter SLC18B1-like [Coccinella septempunctata]
MMSEEKYGATIGSQNYEKKDEENNNEKIKKKHPFTLRQKVALVMLATVDFMSFCSMSIMAPFYPKEAAAKGMTELTAGFVFGFYALVVMLSSPVFGKVMPKVGVKLCFISGTLFSGVCSCAFGLLNMVNDYTTFTVLSFVIRGFEALGASAYSTAGYVIIVNIFPEHSGAVRGLLETFVGLGMSAGPAIGGLLYAVGGFGLPFYVVGLITIVIAPMNIYLLPKLEKFTMEQKAGSFTKLLRLPSVLVTCLILVVVAATWGFLDPTLEPHLRPFNLDAGRIGLIFLLLSAMYGIFCPGWGWLSDKLDTYWWIMSVGLLINFFCLMCLGPSPVLHFLTNTIWLNIVSLSTLGVSVAMAQMPTYRSLLDSAMVGGFTETIGTHSLIAGLWSCVYSMGEVIGPIAGGALMENYGFPVTSTVFAVANLVTSILVTLFFMTRTKKEVVEVPKNNKPIIITAENFNNGAAVVVKDQSSEIVNSISVSDSECFKS